ncbi:hypothetical protein F0562_028068 [Nyssa sinensis]|uniref:Uncharacterized protein n=1 Tax=Nyssa sinensis TaxID=561372 RepID=A0A5J5B7T9_9ASTE|nr:hypothetical protein F0562_028068 [Nyssa sinensis]
MLQGAAPREKELSTQCVHIQAIHKRQDQFVASLSAMATELHFIFDDKDDDDDGDGDDDDGDFTLDNSTT